MLDRARTSLRLRGLDLADRLRGRHDPLVPPRRLDFVGHSDFAATGDEFLEHFVGLAGLRPTDRVLDIGCGIGRMARPLAGFLAAEGSYDGFDVNRDGIGWCRRRYRGHPNFRFRVADVFNARYNTLGAHRASDYRFPYPDGAFTFACATSVFTHLLEADADRYLAEAARVLAPGGRLFTTWFVLDEVSRAHIAAGTSGLPFLDADAHVAVVSEDLPEEAVAYDAGWVRDRLEAHGLRPREPFGPGSWSGRGDHVSFQDLVVADRDG